LAAAASREAIFTGGYLDSKQWSTARRVHAAGASRRRARSDASAGSPGTDSGHGMQFRLPAPAGSRAGLSPAAPASIMRRRMRAHELTTARREGVRNPGPRALTGAPAR